MKKLNARLINPATSQEYAGKLFPWEMLPEKLRGRLSAKAPIYELEHDAVIEWDGYVWTIKAGYLWDGASIPLSLRMLGVSRFSKGNELFPASLFHDAGWRGTLPRIGTRRDNLRRYTDLYVELAIAAGYPAWRMRWQRAILNARTLLLSGKTYTDQPDPRLVSVRTIDSGRVVYHAFRLDWRVHASGGA